MRRLDNRVLPLLLLACCAPPSLAAAQPTPLGGEFVVNTYTTGPQRHSDVCARPGGEFVIVWDDGRANDFGLDHGRDGDEMAVGGGRFSNNAVPQPLAGNDFVVNSYTTGRQDTPSAACDPDGEFVIGWTERAQNSPPNGGRFGVLGRRYNPDGTPMADPFIIETGQNSLGVPDEGTVCHFPWGGFVTVWNSISPNETTDVRVFDENGVAVATEQLSAGNQPKCCAWDDGFVVSWWLGGASGGKGPDVLAQRFTANGTKIAGPFIVNTYTEHGQVGPDVACKPDGDFVVAWSSIFNIASNPAPTQDGDAGGVFAQAFDQDGNAVGTEIAVNSFTTGDQYDVSVGMDHAGRFVVAWANYQYSQSSYSEDVHAQVFDASANPIGTEFRVNTSMDAGQPAVAMNAVGDFVVTWHRDSGDAANDEEVRGRRYRLPGGVMATTTTTTTTTTSTTLVDDGSRFDITKDDGLHFWGTDEQISFQISVMKTAGPTSDAVVTDVVPAATTFSAAASTAGWQCAPDENAGSTCTYLIQDMAPTDQALLNFVVTVAPGTPSTWIVYNRATVTASGASSFVIESSGATTADTGTVSAPPDRPAGTAPPSSSDDDMTANADCGDLSNPIPLTCDFCCYLFPAPGTACTSSPFSVGGWLRTAAGTIQAAGDLAPLFRLRDSVLPESRGGRRFVDLYYEHGPAMTTAAFVDSDILADGVAAINTLMPNFEALEAGDGAGAIITQGEVDAMNEFLDTLRASAGGDLASAIDRERARLDLASWVGLSAEEALALLDRLTCEGFEDTLFCGEVTGDCRITATDALRVLRIAVGSDPAVDEADLDGNGANTATDALITLNIAVGLEPNRDDCNP